MEYNCLGTWSPAAFNKVFASSEFALLDEFFLKKQYSYTWRQTKLVSLSPEANCKNRVILGNRFWSLQG